MNKYEKILRRVRSSDKLWSEEHSEKCLRIINKCKYILSSEWRKRVNARKSQADQKFLKLWS